MSHLEPALLNVKLPGLGPVLEGAKLFQCLVTDCMPQYYDLARSKFSSVLYQMKHLTCGKHLQALLFRQSFSVLSSGSLLVAPELDGKQHEIHCC